MIVGAAVLAAGKSERMGQNKLLLDLNGKKLIDNFLCTSRPILGQKSSDA